MNILVSACLIGLRTRYAGDGNSIDWITALADRHTLIPVCPEQLGGLPTPRVPCERVGAQVLDKNGEERTHAFASGAEMALNVARLNHCSAAILKQRSPSCGSGVIYDGTFSGTKIPGDGVAAEMLKAAGMRVFSEEDMAECLQWLAANA